MKQILTAVFALLTITTFAQPNRYSGLDFSYKYNMEHLMQEELKGSIRSLMVYKRENYNFHENSQVIDLSAGFPDATKYIITSGQLTEVRSLNLDTTMRAKELYANGLIQKFIFYQKDPIIQSEDIFLYNPSNQLIEKIIKDGKGNIQSSAKYSYSGNNKLEEVTEDHGLNSKYIYDDTGGVYEVKYYKVDEKDSIIDAVYHRYTSSETLDVVLKIQPDAKFADLPGLKRTWQVVYKMDERNRIIFDQKKDLLSDVVESEKSFTYQNDQLVSKTYKSNRGNDEISTLTYKNNKLIRSVTKDKGGYETLTEDWQYNEHGDMLRKRLKGFGGKEEIHEYVYTYDSHNNWIQKKETINGKLFRIRYRQIVYEK